MRHVFILNPVAGKSKSALALRGRIDAYFARHPEMEYSIRLTDGVGSATCIATEECECGGAVRLYACGGDGTLQETANGIPVGSADVELAVIPCVPTALQKNFRIWITSSTAWRSRWMPLIADVLTRLTLRLLAWMRLWVKK